MQDTDRENGQPLISRLKRRDWRELEEAAVRSATAGGMAAMGYYRNAVNVSSALDAGKNPSTLADIEATVTIVRTAHSLLFPIAARVGCALSYLAEETSDRRKRLMVSRLLEDDIRSRLHNPSRFFAASGLRVMLDAIDGTNNFSKGIPLFCSAVAVLVDEQVRVSAVYDPIHHVVYSGVLRGPADNPEADREAWVWHVATGSREKLPDSASLKKLPLDEELIATHLSRTKKDALRAFVRMNGSDPGMLESLALAAGGIYALNSGVLAMAKVAQGSLGAFVNIATHPWDVAAGEVLVRASGGKVTNVNGEPLDYSRDETVSVLAAKAHLHAELLGIVFA